MTPISDSIYVKYLYKFSKCRVNYELNKKEKTTENLYWLKNILFLQQIENIHAKNTENMSHMPTFSKIAKIMNY